MTDKLIDTLDEDIAKNFNMKKCCELGYKIIKDLEENNVNDLEFLFIKSMVEETWFTPED